jgi:hypothetical protein
MRLMNGVAHTVFRDLAQKEAKAIHIGRVSLMAAPVQHDDILDNLPPLIERNGKYELPAERLTVQTAVDRFIAKYPLAFEDPAYIGDRKTGERFYKWAAHETWQSDLGAGQLRKLLSDIPELTRRAMHCVGRVNLLYPIEQAAMRDALQHTAAAEAYFFALAGFLEEAEINEETCTTYFREVINLPQVQARVATWPVATVLPFLAQPDRHLFIKPSITKEAADRLGFHLNYKAEPNWLTYKRALEMARIYREKIAHLRPRDMIDVQSFFWITSGAKRLT